ncbi:unnamed protein product [Lactuca virosa]|uniref:Uncharacterized protein n=1 Tax=Lactuca virosa TaxID=75947 RepID=A0AAU9PMA1_9ASTR|nr:unnamed protein product [Lactuca virosa]
MLTPDLDITTDRNRCNCCLEKPTGVALRICEFLLLAAFLVAETRLLMNLQTFEGEINMKCLFIHNCIFFKRNENLKRDHQKVFIT